MMAVLKKWQDSVAAFGRTHCVQLVAAAVSLPFGVSWQQLLCGGQLVVFTS